MKGTIFSVEEFAVHDGAGVRVNVFFKGCPLRCRWCHNPEGWKSKPEVVKNPNGCLKCGICERICTHKGNCVLCKKCVYNCPRDLIRVSGEVWEAADLAAKLRSYKDVLEMCGGGLTFSGGEVLMQSGFLCEVLDGTKGLNRIIETSGYGGEAEFKRVLDRIDFAYYDIKIMDEEKHKFYTGVSNRIILKNAETLMKSYIPFTFRIPLMTEVNCDSENMHKVCEFARLAKNIVSIELLPYNEMAGAKYPLAGIEYKYSFTKPSAEVLDGLEGIIESYGIKCNIRGKA